MTFRASSAVAASISGLLMWDAMVGQSPILSHQSWSKMWEDVVPAQKRPSGKTSHYGYGWGVSSINGHRLLTHSGSNPGFNTEYWKFIYDQSSIIILTNTDHLDLSKIAREIYVLMN